MSANVIGLRAADRDREDFSVESFTDARAKITGPIGAWPDALVPPDLYAVAFVSVLTVKNYGRQTWKCRFRIVKSGSCFGVEIPRFLAKPTGRLRRSHALFMDGCMVLGKVPPQTITPLALFMGRVVTASVVSVVKNSRGDVLPRSAWYSRIERIVGLETGS